MTMHSKENFPLSRTDHGSLACFLYFKNTESKAAYRIHWFNLYDWKYAIHLFIISLFRKTCTRSF